MANHSRAVPTTYSLIRSDSNRAAYKMPPGERIRWNGLKRKDPTLTMELAKFVLDLVTKEGHQLNGGRIPFDDPDVKKLDPGMIITDAEKKQD